MAPTQMYRFRWNRCSRKDHRCLVTARGAMNSCRLEFEDGFVMITSRNAIAKVREWPPWRSSKIVFQAPADATYVCSDEGWWYYVRGSEIFAARWPRNDSYMLPADRKRGRARAEAAAIVDGTLPLPHDPERDGLR